MSALSEPTARWATNSRQRTRTSTRTASGNAGNARRGVPPRAGSASGSVSGPRDLTATIDRPPAAAPVHAARCPLPERHVRLERPGLRADAGVAVVAGEDRRDPVDHGAGFAAHAGRGCWV